MATKNDTQAQYFDSLFDFRSFYIRNIIITGLFSISIWSYLNYMNVLLVRIEMEWYEVIHSKLCNCKILHNSLSLHV